MFVFEYISSIPFFFFIFLVVIIMYYLNEDDKILFYIIFRHKRCLILYIYHPQHKRIELMSMNLWHKHFYWKHYVMAIKVIIYYYNYYYEDFIIKFIDRNIFVNFCTFYIEFNIKIGFLQGIWQIFDTPHTHTYFIERHSICF